MGLSKQRETVLYKGWQKRNYRVFTHNIIVHVILYDDDDDDDEDDLAVYTRL